jgi:hypothetical protein
MINRKVFETQEDWKEYRRGLFTASQIHRLLAKAASGSGLSKGAKTYVKEILAEMIAPPAPDYYNSAMQRGNEIEPQAVLAYAKAFDLNVNDKDFIYTSIGGHVFFWDEAFNVGGTPDIILADRICEIKCPDSKTHLEYLLCDTGEDLQQLKPEYYSQMQLNMYLCERDMCHFISYDDRLFDEMLHLKIIEVERDEVHIKLILDKATEATNYLNILKEKIKWN